MSPEKQKRIRLRRYLKPYWFLALMSPVSMFLEVSMDLLQPTLMARIVDEGVLKGDMQTIIATGLWMLVLSVFGGIGGLAAAASPALLAERSESLWDGIAQESEMARICYGVNPRFRIPSYPGVFAPAGILADRAADSGITPKMHGGILSKTSGGQIGVGYARTPLACFEKAAGNV